MQNILLERKFCHLLLFIFLLACFMLLMINIYIHRIEGVVAKWGINETFVGIILLPIVGKPVF